MVDKRQGDGRLYRVELQPDSVLFREGDAGEEAYIVESGLLEVVRETAEGGLVLARLGPGEILGEMALFDNAPRSATIVAVEETTLLTVDRRQIETKIRNADPTVALLLNTLVARLRSMQSLLGNPGELDASASRDGAGGSDDTRQILRFERQLIEGLERQQFFVVFQPIVELASGRLAGFEALVRWRHPELGNVSPERFIPIAEDLEAIGRLDQEIISRSLDFAVQANARRRPSGVPLYVSFNLSPVRFSDGGVLNDIDDALAARKADPAMLKAEINEQVLISDAQQAMSLLEGIRSCGVRVLLDDFGTGYSSLSYLAKLPIDTLKVDRSFVHAMCHSTQSETILTSICAMAQALGHDVVAEGIETAEQAEALKLMGCAYGQGYHYAQPLEFEDAMRVVAAGTPG